MNEKFLPDICKIQYGFPFNSDLFSPSEGIPLVRIRDVVRGYSLTYTTEGYKDDYIVHNGDILIGMDGEFNIARWKGGNALLNQRVCRLFPLNVDSDYLLYYLQKVLKRIENETPFSTVKHLSAKRLNAIQVPLPSIKEQLHVSSVLNKIGELIALHKQQLAKLDELVKARFVEMFGDPEVNEKGFSTFHGKDLFIFSSGKFLPEERRLKSGYPVYGGNGIAWYTDNPLTEVPTIIIGRVGAQCGNIHLVTSPVWITDNAIYIKKFLNDKISLRFLSALMEIMDFRQYAEFSGQPKITQKPLNELCYIIPPFESQLQFDALAEYVDCFRLLILSGLSKLETLKASLMQEYFGGGVS